MLLCSAPIVEGALTAAVQASVGASLQQAAAEANGALQVKIQQLAPVTGEHIEMTASKERLSGDDEANAEVLSFEWIIENRLGLHARPAAALVTTAGKFESRVLLRKVGENSIRQTHDAGCPAGCQAGRTTDCGDFWARCRCGGCGTECTAQGLFWRTRRRGCGCRGTGAVGGDCEGWLP